MRKRAHRTPNRKPVLDRCGRREFQPLQLDGVVRFLAVNRYCTRRTHRKTVLAAHAARRLGHHRTSVLADLQRLERAVAHTLSAGDTACEVNRKEFGMFFHMPNVPFFNHLPVSTAVQSMTTHPHIQRPSNGILLIATDTADEMMNDDAAVATIANGVDNLGRKNAKNGNRTNMCKRYVP